MSEAIRLALVNALRCRSSLVLVPTNQYIGDYFGRHVSMMQVCGAEVHFRVASRHASLKSVAVHDLFIVDEERCDPVGVHLAKERVK